jgi:hypothetical protein
MQLISVYLYQNKIDVFTNADSAWLTERYRRVYNRNIKIYRGVDNRIDIQVRNSDEKAASAAGSTLVFNLVEPETQTLVARKDCIVIDAIKGKFYVTLTEREMTDIEAGFYQFSIYKESRTDNGDGTHIVSSRTPVYIDAQYDIMTTLEVLESGQGDVQPSTVIREFEFHKSFGEPFDSYYVSGIIDADPQISTPQSLHTFQISSTNYSGVIKIQGSIAEGATPKTWVDLETLTVSNSTMQFKNVVGKYNWFRVKHTPNKLITNPGTVDKILYR